MPEKTIWFDDHEVYLLDQTRLPRERHVLEINSISEMWDAIKTLKVRGAPAIGIAAALGVWLALRHHSDKDSIPLVQVVENACKYLSTARPTAVNLFWALNRIQDVAHNNPDLKDARFKQRILDEALAMLEEDNAVCLAIGKFGAELLHDGDCVLTHCNAGGLATAQFGTALSVIYYAVGQQGKKISVFADETRPLLQGSRLTAWELMQANVPVTIICDNMAGSVMHKGWINAVIVGTDRVARNGDFANKIGTYGVAVLAREHNIPFYVAAPLSSIDIALTDGSAIPIEERSADEVSGFYGMPVAPDGVKVYNPAFDVTPHELVTAFITEKGVIGPPYDQTIPGLFEN
jgi:methylthioribose-1-phosphate isomerase